MENVMEMIVNNKKISKLCIYLMSLNFIYTTTTNPTLTGSSLGKQYGSANASLTPYSFYANTYNLIYIFSNIPRGTYMFTMTGNLKYPGSILGMYYADSQLSDASGNIITSNISENASNPNGTNTYTCINMNCIFQNSKQTNNYYAYYLPNQNSNLSSWPVTYNGSIQLTRIG